MAPFTESGGGPARIYIVDGARLFALTNPADVVTTADVIVADAVGLEGPAQSNATR